jgi:hypothetical protein
MYLQIKTYYFASKQYVKSIIPFNNCVRAIFLSTRLYNVIDISFSKRLKKKKSKADTRLAIKQLTVV